MNATSKTMKAASTGFAIMEITDHSLPKSTALQLAVPRSIELKIHTQSGLVLQALMQRPHTSDEMHSMGIYEPRSRVAQLRKAGYGITTALIAIIDRDGYHRRGVALYTLEGVPCKQHH